MLDNDPLWYKDAIIYEVHVRAFHDAVGDGWGNFRGLTQKLDYLQDLGVTAIWLLPFYPSPLKDDGYDIADYTDIHPDYGTLADFKEFLDAAHQRGLRVITELVINHTSDQHPWFQRARRAPRGSPERDFYVWSDTPDKYREARIIFKDFEPSNWSWDPVAKAYYWHRFYSHQPDLNYDNPAVWNAIFPVLDFWMKLGVDGMRLDAIPYLFEREGTNCENLPETHDFLRALRRHVDEKFPNRMLLAEANQWPEDSVAYFGHGDETHMAFHFPVMPRMFMAIHMEDRLPLLDIIAQTPAIPDNCQWAMFLRNHDELTLEMVTDEERDYMYKAYAKEPRARINLGIRRRLAPLLDNNRRRIELMNGLLFSLPGTPVLYYGDEIGMGDNIYLGDRNGVRTPMQWSGDRNAGFSRANPQKLFLPVIIDPEYHFETVNVEAQQNNTSSLLWWMKWLINLRRRYKAFGRGSLHFLHPHNRKVLAFLRRYGGRDGAPEDVTITPWPAHAAAAEECLLVVANLSRFAQSVELDLAEFQGMVPVELFGHTPFPVISRSPYVLSLSPHSFYWFSLESQRAGVFLGRNGASERAVPAVRVPGGWEEIFHRKPLRTRLEDVLPGYLQARRGGNGADRSVQSASFREVVPIPTSAGTAYLTLVESMPTAGNPETEVLPLAFASGEEEARILAERRHAVVTRVRGGSRGVLYDAMASPAFCAALLHAIADGQSFPGSSGGQVRATALPSFAPLRPHLDGTTPILSRGEQRNTSIRYGDQAILKVFRRVEDQVNPDLEVGRYLTEKSFPFVAPVLGVLEYRRQGGLSTLGVLHAYEAHEGGAWQFTLDELSRFFERILTLRSDQPAARSPLLPLLDPAAWQPSPQARELIGTYLDSVYLLGQRTAELHFALASQTEDAAFRPEPFSKLYQRSLYQSMRGLLGKVFAQLRQQVGELPEDARADAHALLQQQDEVLRRFHSVIDQKLTSLRIRCHGDYHLGQILHTGKHFVILDFEGDVRRPISERRLKRSALNDVASMMRSFQYAAYNTLFGQQSGRGTPPGIIRPEDFAVLEPWAIFWYTWVSAGFLWSYLEAVDDDPFLPRTPEERLALLAPLLLERAVGELGYDLTYRPGWVRIPLKGILQLLEFGVVAAPV
jgi:maltose alpha-D-glucosyltransferase / alpha-amylase